MGQIIAFTTNANRRITTGAAANHFRGVTKMMPQATYDYFVRLAEQAAINRGTDTYPAQYHTIDDLAKSEALQLLRRIATALEKTPPPK